MATSPTEVRRILQVVRDDAGEDLSRLARSVPRSDVRGLLVELTPALLSAYTDGSSALAVEWYSEIREESRARTAYAPAPVVDLDRERIRRSVLWATESDLDIDAVLARLTPRAEEEIARGFWDTIEQNATRDPEAAGWRRVARFNACPFCRMLADRGAIYRESTARFAAHRNCHCIAEPVFKGGDTGPTASVEQYRASKRRRTDADRAALRKYLRENY